MLPILVGSCFVLYAGIAAAFFFESWFQIHLFALWMLMPIISLFSGNTPSFAILYFSKKNDVRVVWQWLCTAVSVRTLKMFAKIKPKLFLIALNQWHPILKLQLNWGKLYSQNREQCIAQCYLDLWGIFVGTLPLGHVCLSRLSENLEIFKAIRILSRPSGKYPDYLEFFQAIQKLSRPSKKFQD